MKKGFTLIELLAVIVVISIIGLITTPVVINNIEKSKVATYRSSVDNLMDAAKEYVTKNYEDNDFPLGGIDVTKTNLNLKHNEFKSGVITKENGVITAIDVYDGKYCARGEKNNLIVNKVEDINDCKNATMDYTPPEILHVMTPNITSTKITVVVEAHDAQSNIGGYVYCIGDAKCEETTTNNYTFQNLKANTSYDITVKVRNNNYTEDKTSQYDDTKTESIKKINVTTKALEAPIIKVSSTAYGTGKKVEITYPKSGESQKNSYQINNDKPIILDNNSNSISINVDKNETITATIAILNEEGKEVETVKSDITIKGIDTTAPTIEKVQYINNNDDSWGKTKTIEVIASDTGSGLAKRPYSYDGGKTWTNSKKRTYNKKEDEDKTVEIAVRDKVGNISTTQFKLDKLDVTAPGTPSIKNPTNGNWTNKDFALTVSSSDKRSGIGKWYYSYNQTEWIEYENSNGINPFTTTNFTKERNNLVYIKVCDMVGNCSQSSNTYIRIDKTAPGCVSSGGNTSWTNISRTLIGTCSDSGSGCTGNASWLINWQGNWSNLSPGTVYDNAGNSKQCPANQTVRIDKTAPTCSSSKSNTNTTSGVTATFTCSDTGGSGIVSCTPKKTGLTSNSSYTITDVAGNSGTCSVSVSSKTQYQKRTCSTGKSCKDAGCKKYNSCSIAECGVASYKSCEHAECGCAEYSCTLYKVCQNSSCGSTYKKTYTIASSSACNNQCVRNGYSYGDVTGKSCACYSYNSCRASGCGTETVTGSACNNAKSKVCSRNNACRTSGCGVESYNSCEHEKCGCKTYKSSISKCGCKTWNDWTSWSDNVSNHCANSNSCQGKTRTLYY